MINGISKKPTELNSEGGTTEESFLFESGDSSLTSAFAEAATGRQTLNEERFLEMP